jgi:DNA-binding HxlR family transcriptional regulator
MSPTVLYQRLSELSQAGLVTRTGDQRYELTEVGRALGAALDPLNRWAHQWAKAIPSAGESHSTAPADDAAADEATR